MTSSTAENCNRSTA